MKKIGKMGYAQWILFRMKLDWQQKRIDNIWLQWNTDKMKYGRFNSWFEQIFFFISILFYLIGCCLIPARSGSNLYTIKMPRACVPIQHFIAWMWFEWAEWTDFVRVCGWTKKKWRRRRNRSKNRHFFFVGLFQIIEVEVDHYALRFTTILLVVGRWMLMCLFECVEWFEPYETTFGYLKQED